MIQGISLDRTIIAEVFCIDEVFYTFIRPNQEQLPKMQLQMQLCPLAVIEPTVLDSNHRAAGSIRAREPIQLYFFATASGYSSDKYIKFTLDNFNLQNPSIIP